MIIILAQMGKISRRGVGPPTALTDELSTRGQKPLLEVANTQHLALTEGDVPKGRASGAAPHPTEGGEVTVINECPLLHPQYPMSAST